MRKPFKLVSFTLVLLLTLTSLSSGSLTTSRAQEKESALPVCKAGALRNRLPLPLLRYRCKPGSIESDDALLKWPARLSALKLVSSQLAALTSPGWWQTSVDELNVCDFRKRVGRFSAQEVQKFNDDYRVRLLGNSSVRVVIVFDPCYQTEWNGSVVFLLSRSMGKVSVTNALDGYFSRVDNSIAFDYADLDGEKIIELQTGNSMPPSLLNYYFAVDAKTNRISARNLFKEGNGLSNQVFSEMLLSDPEDLDLPKDAGELNVIRDHKLAPSFSVYSQDIEGKIDSEGKRFKRTIYKWNGNVYVPEN